MSLLPRRKKKHININKFAGLSQDWVGAKKLFMCFFRVIFHGGEKTHKQNSPKIPRDNPVKILFTCFFLYVFFRETSATKMTGRPGHWSEPGECNILFLGSILVISSQDSTALGYREFTQEGPMTIRPFAAGEGTSAPQ